MSSEKAPDLTSYGTPGGTTDQDLIDWAARNEITKSLEGWLLPDDRREYQIAGVILEDLHAAGYKIVRAEPGR